MSKAIARDETGAALSKRQITTQVAIAIKAMKGFNAKLAPTIVATPLPPLNLSQGLKIRPATAARPITNVCVKLNLSNA